MSAESLQFLLLRRNGVDLAASAAACHDESQQKMTRERREAIEQLKQQRERVEKGVQEILSQMEGVDYPQSGCQDVDAANDALKSAKVVQEKMNASLEREKEKLKKINEEMQKLTQEMQDSGAHISASSARAEKYIEGVREYVVLAVGASPGYFRQGGKL